MSQVPKAGIRAIGVCCLALSGCASTGLSPLSYGVRRVEGGNDVTLFNAARAVLADLGYQIDRADAIAGVITTRPVLQSWRSSDAPARISSGGQWRHVVEVQLDERAEAVNVYCKVSIQQQVTAAHRMFAYDRSGSDLPGDTPIERDAATTEEQNTVWQTVRRDKAAERRILEAILERAQPRPG